MTYNSTQQLLKILKKEKLFVKKRLGQNFLTSNNALKKIITAANINQGELIYEIGPGLGFLTQALIESEAKVHAIELDPAIIAYLENKFSDKKNFTLEKGNALKAKLPTKPYKLVANIPYYITSPILKHFLQTKESSQRPSLIVLLVQKEVAEKICAKEGSHNMLSLQTQIFGKPSIVGKVGKGNFYPSPKVDSAIIKIETYAKPLIKDYEDFFRIISKAFTQKRKMIGKTINTNYKPTSRPQELSIEDWIKIIEEQN